MRFGITLFFGVIPASALGLLALVPLSAGAEQLFDRPSIGSLLIVWSLAGVFGCWTLWRVMFGRWDANTVPGLLAGILAAAPVIVVSPFDNTYPEIVFFWGYWTVCPMGVAAWRLVEGKQPETCGSE